jgi:hypothetical protein
VEVGQVAIVCVLFPLAVALSRWRYAVAGQRTISAIIALCGVCWFLDRAFGLELMPF